MTGRATVIRGDARRLPLADDTVDLIVSSPPYFALRSYQDGGEHYAGQIGSESTIAEWMDAMVEVTRECMRVLKPSGSLFVNLGDKYGERKSLMGIPWRYALRCIDDLGLILRAEVIWAKPNGLPESITDRVRRSHEQWFHFTLQPRYYSAIDEIREAQVGITQNRSRAEGAALNGGGRRWHPAEEYRNPLGKLPGSVWTIPTEPLTVPDHLGIDHYAAFPTEWPRRIIQGWSPPGICTACGEGRRPVTAATYVPARVRWGGTGAIARNRPMMSNLDDSTGNRKAGGINDKVLDKDVTITGYACACPEPTAPTRPAVILDPFGGTGTTALAALALGRHGITVDMSADYSRLARWRTTDQRQLAGAMRIPKPAVQVDGQGSLLELLDDGGAA